MTGEPATRQGGPELPPSKVQSPNAQQLAGTGAQP
jgi:hypothetical protein